MDTPDPKSTESGRPTRGRFGMWLLWGLVVILVAAGAFHAALIYAGSATVGADERQHELLDALQDVRSRVDEVQATVGREEKTLDFDLMLMPMTGPGVRVTIDDVSAVQGATLHDQDLLLLVNELRAAGAEALALNDRRLTDTSAIRCAGPTIQVGGESIGPPYRITAIGDPETLAAALRLPGGIVAELRNVRIQVKTEAAEGLELPAAPFVPPRKGTVRSPENTR